MAKKIKYGKIAGVVFLTILIWVWADRAQDEELTISNAVINVAKSTNPNFLVSFEDETSVPINKIILKGPVSRITEEDRKLKEGKRYEFDFDIAQEKMDNPGYHTLMLLPFLQKNKQIRRLGVKIESCEPPIIGVSVIKLVKKNLDVKCIDENQIPLKSAAVTPAQIQMYVPESWEGEKLTATATLTRAEIEQAKLTEVEKSPHIKLIGQAREAPIKVKIKIAPQENRLSADTIKNVTLGFILSANLQGKYGVKVTNLERVLSTIAIRATPEAKRAYENMRYQVLLEIDDTDKDTPSTEPLRKELIYNFPSEYARKDEIMLDQPPVTARFQLIELSKAESPANSTK